MVAKNRIESVTSNEVRGWGFRVKSEIDQARRMLMEDSEYDYEINEINTIRRTQGCHQETAHPQFQ
jgi:hypothetical protein